MGAATERIADAAFALSAVLKLASDEGNIL